MGLEKGVVMCCGFSHHDMVDPHRVDVVQVGGDVAMKRPSRNSDFCLRDDQSQSKQQAARGYQRPQWVEPLKHLVLCT